MQVKHEARFPKDGGYYRVPAGCTVDLIDGATPEAALERFGHAMTPPTSVQAEEWLIALQVATAGGRRSELAQEVALGLYSGALRRYPADVARQACVDLATVQRPGGNWFPTLADMIALCDRLVADRKQIISGLQKLVAHRRANPSKPQGDQP